jgi:hypothetical protein
VIQPEAQNLAEPLASQNANRLYDAAYMARGGERLLASHGAYWRFYDRTSVERLIAEFAGVER